MKDKTGRKVKTFELKTFGGENKTGRKVEEQLMFKLGLVCLFEGYLNSMYFVLAGFILIFILSHHFMRVLSEAWSLLCIN